MPPRFAYWTIIFGNQPTAFRAQARDELLPTFKQIQTRHPDAVMMWFARGRLWRSPEEARDALQRKHAGGPPRSGERRGPAWRPGGVHRDPKDRFKVPRDVRRKRFSAQQRRDRVSPRPPRPKGPPGPPRARIPRKKKDEE